MSGRFARRGFTLVELLLALALLTVLLGTLYGAFDVYSRLSTAGREGVEQAQLARTILRHIQNDLLSIAFREAAASTSATAQSAATGAASGAAGEGTSGQSSDPNGSSSSPDNASPADSESSSSDASDTEEAPVSQLGLVGDLTTLMIYVNRPLRPDELLAEGPSGSSGGDLKSVSWFLATPNTGGIQGAAGNLAAGGGIRSSRETQTQGLARMRGDPWLLDSADQDGDLQTLAAHTRIVAEEVNYLQFRYFDGLQWLESWDSQSLAALPRAVEILIGFRPPESNVPAAQRGVPAFGAEEPTRIFRLVVALPIDQPNMESSEL